MHDADREAMLADPEARKFLQATMQKQVESWPQEKIPSLGGRTPLEAVRDPDGKEMVEALLLDWERRDERDVSTNQIRPDISALRRLFNLAPQASCVSHPDSATPHLCPAVLPYSTRLYML